VHCPLLAFRAIACITAFPLAWQRAKVPHPAPGGLARVLDNTRIMHGMPRADPGLPVVSATRSTRQDRKTSAAAMVARLRRQFALPVKAARSSRQFEKGRA